jgi:hypothetical protein
MQTLKFKFSIETEDGECLASDWTYFFADDLRRRDDFPAQINIHVGSALNAVLRDLDRAEILQAAE